MTDIFTREMTKEKNLEALRRLQDLEKKRVPKDMTAIQKKFDEKRNEEIKRVEERFDALLKQGDQEFQPPAEEKEEKHEEEEHEEEEP
jgi:dynein intermediate chain 2